MTKSTKGGGGPLKDDKGKSRPDLLPAGALLEVSFVLEYGARKYGPNTWRGLEWSRLYAAALRHLLAFQAGEDDDPETGCPHLAHAAAQVLFLLESCRARLGKDDRL